MRLDVGFGAFISIGLIFLIQVCMLYSTESWSQRMFIAYCDLESTIIEKFEAENESKLNEMRSKELRGLFGNVAHDLKTPSCDDVRIGIISTRGPGN